MGSRRRDTLRLRFKRRDPDLSDGNWDVELEAPPAEELRGVFQEYGIWEVQHTSRQVEKASDGEPREGAEQSSEQSQTSIDQARSCDGEATARVVSQEEASCHWETLNFLPLGKVVYLKPEQTPRQGQLKDCHIIRVTAKKSHNVRSAAERSQAAAQDRGRALLSSAEADARVTVSPANDWGNKPPHVVPSSSEQSNREGAQESLAQEFGKLVLEAPEEGSYVVLGHLRRALASEANGAESLAAGVNDMLNVMKAAAWEQCEGNLVMGAAPTVSDCLRTAVAFTKAYNRLMQEPLPEEPSVELRRMFVLYRVQLLAGRCVLPSASTTLAWSSGMAAETVRAGGQNPAERIRDRSQKKSPVAEVEALLQSSVLTFLFLRVSRTLHITVRSEYGGQIAFMGSCSVGSNVRSMGFSSQCRMAMYLEVARAALLQRGGGRLGDNQFDNVIVGLFRRMLRDARICFTTFPTHVVGYSMGSQALLVLGAAEAHVGLLNVARPRCTNKVFIEGLLVEAECLGIRTGARNAASALERSMREQIEWEATSGDELEWLQQLHARVDQGKGRLGALKSVTVEEGCMNAVQSMVPKTFFADVQDSQEAVQVCGRIRWVVPEGSSASTEQPLPDMFREGLKDVRYLFEQGEPTDPLLSQGSTLQASGAEAVRAEERLLELGRRCNAVGIEVASLGRPQHAIGWFWRGIWMLFQDEAMIERPHPIALALFTNACFAAKAVADCGFDLTGQRHSVAYMCS